MSRVTKRILAFALALAVVSGYIVTRQGVAQASRALGSSQELGASNGSGEPDHSLGDSSGPALGESTNVIKADSVLYASDFAALKNHITNSGKEPITIKLEDNIYMDSAIKVPAESQITIDGQGHFIHEKNALENNFRLAHKAHFVILDCDLYGMTIYGIVRSYGGEGTYSVAEFDQVRYYGPQLMWIEVSGGQAIVRDSEIYINDTAKGEEVFQVPQIYLYGDILIEHLMEKDQNYIRDAVFYTTGGSDQKVVVGDYANVQIRTGSYLFYASAGFLDVSIGKYATVDAEACGGIGRESNGHYIRNFEIKEGGRFSYKQRESTSAAQHNPKFYGRFLKILNFTMEKDSVFLYDTEYTKSAWDGSGGLFLRYSTVTLDNPKIISVYNPGGAFHTDGNNLTSWETTSWQIKGVNAVNCWTGDSDSAPGQDAAWNLPDYGWNTYNAGDSYGSFTIGGPFDLAIPRSGVVSGPAYADVFGNGASLNGMKVWDKNVKRFVVGNIDPFTIDMVSSFHEGISGELDGESVFVTYSVDENPAELKGLPANGEYFLPYNGQAPPVGNTKVTAVGSSMGLRAALVNHSEGDIRIRSVPVLDYGENRVPYETTTYFRRDNETVAEGRMSVVVEDARGPDASDWSLMVRRGTVPGDAPLPDLPENALVFRQDGQDQYLSSRDIRVFYHPQLPSYKPEITYATWEREEGILVKAEPGMMEAGAYRTTLVWSFCFTP